jgi:hypothetical protein
VHQGDADVARREVAVETQAGAHEIIEFAGDFYAAESATDNDKRQIPAAPHRIVADFGLFELLHHVKSQRHRIADRFQREGMIGHAGHEGEIDGGPAGDHRVIKSHPPEPAVIAFVFQLGCCRIDPADFFGSAADRRQQLPQRRRHRVRADRGAGYFRQQRVIDHGIFPIKENDFALVRGKFPAQRLRASDTRKSPADDDDSAHGRLSLRLFRV